MSLHEIREWVDLWSIPEWAVAAGTGTLAYYTYRLARESRDQIDLQRQQAECLNRPLLIEATVSPTEMKTVLFTQIMGDPLIIERSRGALVVESYFDADHFMTQGHFVSVALRNIGAGTAVIADPPATLVTEQRAFEALSMLA